LLVLAVTVVIILLVASLWRGRSLSPSVSGLVPGDERHLTPLPPAQEPLPEPGAEAEAEGNEAAEGLLLLERREPLAYADWQRAARAQWKDLGHPRVGKAGQTLTDLMMDGAASPRGRALYEAMVAFDPTWRPGRHFHWSPEFRQHYDQWIRAVAVGEIDTSTKEEE